VKATRGNYHHGDLANALTAAATQLARDGGPEAVVLREAARKVGVSATAAYRHFAGHGELIHAVKDHAGEQLAASMRAELARTGSLADAGAEALRRLRALGIGYLHFALAEPGLFRTAFCRADKLYAGYPAGAQDAGMMASSPAYQMLSETIDALVSAGLTPPERRPHAEVFAWSAVHGLAMLLLDGPLSHLPENERELAIERALDGVADGLTRRR
jgi:AcrR family transcriptional regulator